ncbi:MAG: hypothetical protein EAZ33_24340 [Oscillatoriales cyanobacterium]|nr:MAG: hypothetical protein EAZ33_24340 [Oscillatoriales cyanobacterium]
MTKEGFNPLAGKSELRQIMVPASCFNRAVSIPLRGKVNCDKFTFNTNQILSYEGFNPLAGKSELRLQVLYTMWL